MWTTARNLTYVQIYNASHMVRDMSPFQELCARVPQLTYGAQVPFDVPVIAHDMFSRFTSTDYISAAGAAALVPSRIGNEQEAIVGETHLNGSAIDPLQLDAGTAAGSGKTPSLGDDSSNTSSSAGTSPVASAFYDIRAALVVVLLVLLALGAAFIYSQRRRRRQHSSSFGRGSSSSSKKKEASGNGGMSSHLHEHRRKRSSASDRLFRRGDGDGDVDAGAEEEETNELLPMQAVRRGEADMRNASRESLRSAQQRSLPRGEELFAVGEDDEEAELEEEEEDSEEEGNMGRPGRRLSGFSEQGMKSQSAGYDVV